MDQRADFNHRRGGANVGKGSVMRLAHSRVLPDVSDEDACADNIGECAVQLGQGRRDDCQTTFRLRSGATWRDRAVRLNCCSSADVNQIADSDGAGVAELSFEGTG